MGAQMLKEGGDILLGRGEQHAVPAFDELGKGLQVAVIGLAGERTQAFLHAKIGLVVLKKSEIARAVHSVDYPRARTLTGGRPHVTEPRSSRNQSHYPDPEFFKLSDVLQAHGMSVKENRVGRILKRTEEHLHSCTDRNPQMDGRRI